MPEGTRLTRAEDIGALSTLWQEVFGDGGELISAFFRLLWRPGYGRVAEEGGRIVSMGFCLPGARAGALDCAYIYAMATAEGERGRGHAARIGRALMAKPKMLLLDEPVAGLDPNATREMYELVASLNRHDGITIIMVSHDIPAAMQYARHILYIGEPLFWGSTEQFRSSGIACHFQEDPAQKEAGFHD